MFTKAYSATVHGLEGKIITVETDISDGLPLYDLVGYLSSEVREAKERVKLAMKNSGFRLLSKRVTINLSPANLRKEGTGFDLAMAISILASYGFVAERELNQTVIIGELGLDGHVCSVNGILPIVMAAKDAGYQRCLVPLENAKEGAVVQGIDIYGIETLRQAVDLLNGTDQIDPYHVDVASIFEEGLEQYEVDFSDIKGQQIVKRALEIAVSGMHNIVLIGPPGTGKTMIAKTVPSIMPELTLEESMEITRIYSVGGKLNNSSPLLVRRPFRAPHHTSTRSTLIGGGRYPKPGEVSMAHQGVLFLDELTEFGRQVLEVLREPLEDHNVTVSRLHAAYSYPASCMLIGALNPCSCGYYPDTTRCKCSEADLRNYLGKISRPLLDRIDMTVEVSRVEYKDFQGTSKETSKDIRERVKATQRIQKDRYKDEHFRYNAFIPANKINEYCVLGERENKLMQQVYGMMELSGRSYHKILKVARTIADLEESERITTNHLSEAIMYRCIEKKYWGSKRES